MTHRPRLSTLRQDAGPLSLAAVGLLALTGAAIITFTTPTRYTEHRPTGPRVEVTATYLVPRPVVGEECYRSGAVGVSAAGPVACRVAASELRWAVS
jgi:hypothetical protein